MIAFQEKFHWLIELSDQRRLKSILLLTGAFTFAFLFGELVHEFGHYFCHVVYDNAGVQVHIDPFGGTHISGADGLTDKVLGVTSAAGPLLNLASGLALFLLLWRLRRPILLPLLLWGAVAMIQEGVTFSLGLLTPGGDADWISVLGVPEPIILVLGLMLLVAGIGTVALLLPLAGITRDDPARTKLVILLTGTCSLMMVRAVHSFLVAPESVMENFIPMVFAVLLAAIIALVYPVVIKISSKTVSSQMFIVTWSATFIALVLGAATFFFQVFAFN